MMALSASADRPAAQAVGWDTTLLWVALALTAVGIVMVASASIPVADRALQEPLYFLQRQVIYVGVGLMLGFVVLNMPLQSWYVSSPWLLAAVFVLLALVLVPGIGKAVNGSTRWLDLGFIQVQVSEGAKLLVAVFMAGYLVRRGDEVRDSASGFVKPMVLLALVCGLILLEPDLGAVVVLAATVLGMMYTAGVRWSRFALLLCLCALALLALAYFSPYRWARVVSFLNPWEDPFKSGFQLTQALMAIGRGEFLGVGLGGSVQKLFYLPERHTDFLFAILAEELGLLGVSVVIGLYAVLVWRGLRIAAQASAAQEYFGAYLAFGLTFWLGLQAYINIGVNMGVLPTKGLTLPLMSYGGSSMLISCVAVALLLRIGYETARTNPRAALQKGVLS